MLKIPCTDNIFVDESHRVFRDEIELKDDYRDDKIVLRIQGKTKLLHREWLYLYARFQFPEFINIDHISFSKYSGLALKLIKRMIRHRLETDRFELRKI